MIAAPPLRLELGRRWALQATELSHALGRRNVVDGVSLKVSSGEVVGLLGPNGAGKSTIFRCLVGLLIPDSGEVALFWPAPSSAGTETTPSPGTARLVITRWPPHHRARLGIGFLPQEPSTFTGLTVAQNIEAVLGLAGSSRARARERAGELLASFGLEALARQRSGTLSGGERRRLELARMLATEPGLVLLDEPFKGLDPRAAESLGQRLALLAERGAAVLLTDHHVQQALTICHRAYILVGGKVVACGTPAEVAVSPKVKQTYWGWEPQVNSELP